MKDNKSTKNIFIEALREANKDIPEEVLTTGRLIEHLLQFRPNIPVKVVQANQELQIGFIGEDPHDTEAWDDSFEYSIPAKANVYMVCVMPPPIYDE